jgi:hypothetical protein
MRRPDSNREPLTLVEIENLEVPEVLKTSTLKVGDKVHHVDDLDICGVVLEVNNNPSYRESRILSGQINDQICLVEWENSEISRLQYTAKLVLEDHVDGTKWFKDMSKRLDKFGEEQRTKKMPNFNSNSRIPKR